jgi:hypothetical protein
LEILPDQTAGRLMGFHEDGDMCPPTQRLQSDGATAREQIEDGGTVDAHAKDIEKRLTHAVGCGS